MTQHPPLLICFDPSPWHSFRELRDFRKEMLSMDQSHPQVIEALADVDEAIREKKESKS